MTFFQYTDVKYILLAVYVDSIVITSNERCNIVALEFLQSEIQTKNLGKYFLALRLRSSKGTFLSQRKYALDLLNQTGLQGHKPYEMLMEININYQQDIRRLLLIQKKTQKVTW